MLRIAVTAALLLAPITARAQTAEQKVATDLALQRGKLLYAYDQAAWHGSDDMLKKVERPQDVVGGWIVDGPAEAPTIIFFDRNLADPHAVYIGQFRGSELVSSHAVGSSDDASLSPARKAMIAARQKGLAAWRAQKPLFCSEASPNSVVLPPEREGGPYLVYVMTPQTQANAWPLGGHFRVEVGTDGKIGPARGFTKSCLTIPGAPRKGKEPPILFVTHLLDPVPTEIHVFTALAAKAYVAVGTGKDSIWFVSGDRIETTPIGKR